jgi:hypothetical protein
VASIFSQGIFQGFTSRLEITQREIEKWRGPLKKTPSETAVIACHCIFKVLSGSFHDITLVAGVIIPLSGPVKGYNWL